MEEGLSLFQKLRNKKMSKNAITTFSGDSNLLSSQKKPSSQHQKVCINFVHGTCKFGDNCRFLHEEPPFCPHLANYGNCRFGKTCRYSHKLNDDVIIPSWDILEQSVDYNDVFDRRNTLQSFAEHPRRIYHNDCHCIEATLVKCYMYSVMSLVGDVDLAHCPVHPDLHEGFVKVMSINYYQMYPRARDNATDSDGNRLSPRVVINEDIITEDYNDFYVVSYHLDKNEYEVSGAFTREEMHSFYPPIVGDWSVYTSHGGQGNFWGFNESVFTNYYRALMENTHIQPVIMECAELFFFEGSVF